MKKMISIILSMAMLLSMSVSAFAVEKEPDDAIVLEDSASVRTARTEDDAFIYEATYNKVHNTVQLIQIDKKTGKRAAGEVTKVPSLKELSGVATNRAATLEEKTFTNYEYEKTYGTPNKWELRKPGDVSFLTKESFQTYETSKNKTYITAFKNAVDKINTQEGKIVEALGLAALAYLAGGAAGAGAIFTGGTMTPAAWAALLVAGGYSKNYVDVVMEYDSFCKDAFDAYMETYNHSKIL